jgi:gliding motility-associated-like protein
LRTPRCESPFSNVISTIFAEAGIDTCNKKIELKWNSYISSPYQVLSYSVFYTENGGPFTEAAQVLPDKSNFILTDFTTGSEYCFVVRANLEGGILSTSNKVCFQTNMQRPPQWINADYVTIQPDNALKISFTVDPASEIRTLHLERKTGPSVSFNWIAQVTALSGSLSYIDNGADRNNLNYYRAYAQNNCGIPITYSNIASNIVLTAERIENKILLKWNLYKQWNGIINSQKLYVNTSGTLDERYSISPNDTTFTINYSDLMYEISGKEVCFMIKAEESSNPYGINGNSSSSVACIPVIEMVTVPNIFTPDNNLINDRFRPVLSFTPTSYSLIITDLQRKTLFKTDDLTEEWDGTRNGSPLPEGVYLWFLKTRTPSGRAITKTGTVTIIYNR